MRGLDVVAPTDQALTTSDPWWKELTLRHCFVLIFAALDCLFDAMDQQLFNLARVPAMSGLLALAAGARDKFVSSEILVRDAHALGTAWRQPLLLSPS